MKQIEAKIMDHSYLLACPEGEEEQLMKAVHQVDEVMCQIRNSGKVRSRERIAVLAALNLASEAAGQTHGCTAAEPPSPAQADKLNSLLTKLDHALSRDDNLL